VLPIAPSVYYELKARQGDPDRQPPRVRHDQRVSEQIQRVWRDNREVYGVRKVWNQLKREGQVVGRCTVTRVMRALSGVSGLTWKFLSPARSGARVWKSKRHPRRYRPTFE
jgi:hypothetical protein